MGPNIKIVGVTFTNGLSVALQCSALTSNAQALYALKILHPHGVCDTSTGSFLFCSFDMVFIYFAYAVRQNAWPQKVEGFDYDEQKLIFLILIFLQLYQACF